MELKQLEFFLMCVECGSLGKAAEKLYTSQPNVSKIIRSLEEELGEEVFERTSRGLRLTSYGKSIYEYAVNSVKNAKLIAETKSAKQTNTLYVSAYQSNSIAKLLVQVYKKYPDITIEHRQGTVEEIITHVEQGISEIGILYLAQNKINAFYNIISRKNLQFTILAKRKACLYAGPNSPLYGRDNISAHELPSLRYVSGLSDFFSVENGIEHVRLGPVNTSSFQHAVYTNSEHLATNFLLQTDVVDIGINFDYKTGNQYQIKKLLIEGNQSYLTLGYVTEKEHKLSPYAAELIENIKTNI